MKTMYLQSTHILKHDTLSAHANAHEYVISSLEKNKGRTKNAGRNFIMLHHKAEYQHVKGQIGTQPHRLFKVQRAACCFRGTGSVLSLSGLLGERYKESRS